jgi:hypothetical protein
MLVPPSAGCCRDRASGGTENVIALALARYPGP